MARNGTRPPPSGRLRRLAEQHGNAIRINDSSSSLQGIFAPPQTYGKLHPPYFDCEAIAKALHLTCSQQGCSLRRPSPRFFLNFPSATLFAFRSSHQLLKRDSSTCCPSFEYSSNFHLFLHEPPQPLYLPSVFPKLHPSFPPLFSRMFHVVVMHRPPLRPLLRNMFFSFPRPLQSSSFDRHSLSTSRLCSLHPPFTLPFTLSLLQILSENIRYEYIVHLTRNPFLPSPVSGRAPP